MEHPEYTAPEGVDGAEPIDNTIVTEPETVDSGEGDPGGDGAEGAAEDSIPKHRLDEVIAQREATEQRLAEIQRENAATQAELARLRKAAAAAFGVETPGGDATVDPKVAAAKARLLEIMPELKDLLELAGRKDDLLGVAGQLPHIKSSTENYWNRVADVTTGKVFDTLATTLLGEGKTGKDLNARQRAKIQNDFVAWIEEDQSGQREQRYESMDPKLVDEFRDDVEGIYLSAIRRTQNAATLAAGRTTARLPVGGSSSAAVAGGTPVKKPTNDDEAADMAWEHTKAQLAAQ